MLKYPKLERVSRVLPHEDEALYVATEKLDGANFQIVVDKDGELSYFRRTGELSLDEKFYDFQSAVKDKEIVGLIEKVKEHFIFDEYDKVHLFGELYGGGINRRIPYLEKGEVKIKFFDIFLTGENAYKRIFSFNELINLFDRFGYLNLLVPVIKIGTWEEVWGIDVESLKSVVSYKEDAISEGVVIKPLTKVILDYYGSPVYVKKKSKAFEEISSIKKEREPKEVHPLEEMFGTYINENRVLSYFSKEGRIKYYDQIGLYIKPILDDAWEDFVEDYPEALPDKRKIVGKNGKIVAYILKKVLEGDF